MKTVPFQILGIEFIKGHDGRLLIVNRVKIKTPAIQDTVMVSELLETQEVELEPLQNRKIKFSAIKGASEVVFVWRIKYPSNKIIIKVKTRFGDYIKIEEAEFSPLE